MSRNLLKRISMFLVVVFVASIFYSTGMLGAKAAETYATDLFISEYIEGSGSNKAIEIFNGTSGDVDLSQYVVEQYSNGASFTATTGVYKLPLTGILRSGETYVIVNNGANIPQLKAIADKTETSITGFNGDDAIVLKKKISDTEYSIIDCIGKVGERPSNKWGTGTCTTQDYTLIRMSSKLGDSNASDAFDPANEWISREIDDYSDLGKHTMDGFVASNVNEVYPNYPVGAVYEGTAIELTTETEGANIYYTVDGSDPAPGTLYTEPILVNAGMTIKAKAVKTGLTDGKIATLTYTTVVKPILETIETAKTKASGGATVRVSGVVTRKIGAYVYIQDAKDGLQIYQSRLPVDVGDEVEVIGKISVYSQQYQIASPTGAYVQAFVKSKNNTISPIEVTISQISDIYEGKLVLLNNVTLGSTANFLTTITDTSGKSINIKNMPALSGIAVGDVINVIANVNDANGTFQLVVAKAEDITKVDLGPDTTAPVITHTAVTTCSALADFSVSADVTDDREVGQVKLYYSIETAPYNSVNMTLNNSLYTGVVPQAEITTAGALRYYIEAKDSTGNTSTYPTDTNAPVSVEVLQEKVDVTSIQISKPTAQVMVGKTVSLTATILPEGATNKNVTWFSGDETIATVDAGVITGVKAGTVKITVTSSDNSSIKAECQVTVVPDPGYISISEARAAATGQTVTIRGIITGKLGNNAFIEDESAASYLYTGNTAITGVEIGNLVKLTGLIDIYNSAFQLKNITGVEVLETAQTVPAPIDLTIPEVIKTFEGKVVRLRDVKVKTIPSTPKDSGYSITVTDGTNNIDLRFDSSINPKISSSLFKVDDVLTVTGHVSQFKTAFQLMIRTIGDIQIKDTVIPVITHTVVATGNTEKDLEVKTAVTDNREVREVKLYYRTKGTTTYKNIAMELSGTEYVALIPKADLNVAGLEYYISASDGSNTVTSPVDSTTPYEVAISDADITAPEITEYLPKKGSATGENMRPVISVKYTDKTGVDTANIKLYVNGVDVTANAVITESQVTYTPATDMETGEKTVRVVVPDKVATANVQDFTWTFYAGIQQFNLYFGQLHSHTNLSDGQGTPDDAYTWARDNAKADFFAITDHSNSFDASTDSENITDFTQSTSAEWKQLRNTANSYNKDGEFVAIGGYEMTWSGSTGGWGHINTFNTEWFASRNNAAMNLQKYYERIAKDTTSISQLNHPGTTFGDFGDFGYWTPQADKVVNLIEVGNGEGPVRGSGYFPSYEYYTRALDKGWHVAPTNNQDNHKGAWVSANTARTVILAQGLTRDSIYKAMSERKVYATEDSNLNIMYKVNDEYMGSILNSPSKLDFSININDPDVADVIGKVSIIVDGGIVAAEKTFTSNTAAWEFSLDTKYTYYYVRVDQADKDIAVTAPVWTGAVVPVGVSKVEVSQQPQIVGTPTDISATVYNNGVTPLTNVKVEFYNKEVAPTNKIGEQVIENVAAATSSKATIKYSPEYAGSYKIIAKAYITVDGVETGYIGSTSWLVVNAEDVTKMVIDGGHKNQYVTGSYSGNMKTLAATLTNKEMMLVQNNDTLTAEDLTNAKILFLTDPDATLSYTADEIKVIQDFVAAGGALVITSRADYKDATDAAQQGAAQGNAVLEAIGSNLRFNDDEVIDKTSNGGQEFRLYFDEYTSSKYNLTKDVPAGYTYSAYSGCSVILKAGGNAANVDWIVKGHETTEILDSDLQNDATPVTKGNVYTLAAEVLPNGSKVVVAGTTFFSDFETATSDNAYSNKQITENVINWMSPPVVIPTSNIADVRVDANNDGKPDKLGKKVVVEGRVTAASKEAVKNTAFFDVMYLQDATGGITVFGVSTKAVPLGARVKITGYVDQYDGDAEIQISDEKYIEVLDQTVEIVEPTKLSTNDSMLEANEGKLIKVEGIVTRITENNLYIDDGSGESRVYVNGYIGDDTDNTDMLGKWDSSIEVGSKVSAIGLGSEDPEGHRLRVRNTSEIVNLGITLIVDGEPLSYFEADYPNYYYFVSPFATELPVVSYKAAPNSKLKVEITQATKIGESAIVKVSSETGEEIITYTIEFVAPMQIEKVSVQTEYEKGKQAIIKFRATNIAAYDREATLIVGLFDSTGKLVNLVAGRHIINGEETTELSAIISTPNADGYYIKCFVWDNLEDMNPLSSVIVIPVK